MLASRTFDAADQARFARLSGDYNPIHMDAVVARRTQAGARVVHGIHTLLWLLDVVAARHPEMAAASSLKVRFRKMVYLGDRVDAVVAQLTGDALRARVSALGVEVMSLHATLGAPVPASTAPVDVSAEPVLRPAAPRDLALADMEGQSGRLAFAASLAETERAFPSVSKLLGARRVAALGCSSCLVGMVVPGLHSIYGGLTLKFTADADPAEHLRFAVTSVDARFRRVEMEIMGGGVSGSLETFARVPPVLQPSIEEVASRVSRDAFKGAVALVVGGSRGLGELTAKVIAAGGGRVIVTYATGKTDAEHLAEQIRGWGGYCDALAYDVREDAHRQLESLAHPFTHLYYFATPTIFRKKADLCVRERFVEFNEFYVHGFLRTVDAGLRLRPAGITVFYPSTVYVEDRPADMTEYAMSKAAGEVLCRDIAQYRPGVRVIVRRLPRVATDQTATLTAMESTDSLSVMLPIILQMQAPY